MGEIQNYRTGAPVRMVSPAAWRSARGQVIDVQPIAQSAGVWQVLTGSRPDLIKEVKRGSKRGEFGRVGELRALDAATWTVPVYRIKPAPPRWRKPAVIAASVMTVLGSLFGLGWWFVAATTAALAGHGSAVAGVLVVAGVITLVVLRRPIVKVIVKIG